jgi:hypothetical protein
MVNEEGRTLKEGDWVTISSRYKTLFLGRAVYAPARLLRFMNGEAVELGPEETRYFQELAAYYREYRAILESVGAGEFSSLQDLGHAARYGKLKEDRERAGRFVNDCFDVNRDRLVQSLFQTTLGSHLVNLTAFELLTVERRAGLLRDALALSLRRRVSGYQAGAFVIGSLVSVEAPVAFWRSFELCDVAVLLNEWVLHQKYLEILSDVGESRVSRAKEHILSAGLGSLRIHTGLVSSLLPLKLSGIDLSRVRKALPEAADPQTAEVLDVLNKPYGEFVDYTKPWSLSRFKRLCEAEGLPLPSPEDR